MSFLNFRKKKAARKYIRKISLSILAVIEGLKPAYLWDEFSADVGEIATYVEDFSRTFSHKVDLKVLKIGDDVFIVNSKVVRTHLKNINKRVELIDVSPSNEHPITIRGGKDVILKNVTDCFNYYADTNASPLPLTEAPRCNLTTLYGALLGYPVLYWFDKHDVSCDTCLSMLPLTVYQMTARQKNSIIEKPMILYSFSIPEMMTNVHHSIIQTWFSDIKRTESLTFSNIELVTHHVTLPAVAL